MKPISSFLKTGALLLCATFALSHAVASAATGQDSPYRLIGHRGGVVEDKFPDNCAGALQAATARGYWMIETDIRETKDGLLVMHHDTDFKTYFKEPRKIIDLTWDEIKNLHSDLADQHPWRFEDLVKTAHDTGMRLMLDSKDPHTAGFAEKVEAILRKYDMLDRCYIIGTRDAMDHFAGKAMVGAKFGLLQQKVATDPEVKSKYFLFGEGKMTDEQIKWAMARGIKVVSSINIYHYYDAATMKGKPLEELKKIIFAAARADIERHKALGVREFQIDSEFDGWF